MLLGFRRGTRMVAILQRQHRHTYLLLARKIGRGGETKNTKISILSTHNTALSNASNCRVPKWSVSTTPIIQTTNIHPPSRCSRRFSLSRLAIIVTLNGRDYTLLHYSVARTLPKIGFQVSTVPGTFIHFTFSVHRTRFDKPIVYGIVSYVARRSERSSCASEPANPFSLDCPTKSASPPAPAPNTVFGRIKTPTPKSNYFGRRYT
jgi:hypothetical protein